MKSTVLNSKSESNDQNLAKLGRTLLNQSKIRAFKRNAKGKSLFACDCMATRILDAGTIVHLLSSSTCESTSRFPIQPLGYRLISPYDPPISLLSNWTGFQFAVQSGCNTGLITRADDLGFRTPRFREVNYFSLQFFVEIMGNRLFY